MTATIRATISSSDSNGAPASSSDPRRFIRAPVDSSAEQHDPPLQVLLRARQLGVGRRLFAKPLELGGDNGQRLREVVGPRPDVEADLAAVLVAAGKRVDGVGETAPLANLLEQPRGRCAAEDRVEYPEGKATIVVSRESWTAEAHVVLLGVLALEPPRRG